MRVIYFDIDGTLLRGFGAGRLAFERVFERVLGITHSMATYNFSGATDQNIFQRVADHYQKKLNPEEWANYYLEFPKIMADTLSERAMLSYPGVVSILEFLAEQEDVLLAVATGNLQATASLKLKSGGLENYFLNQKGPGAGSQLVGGFGDDAVDRTDIVKAGHKRIHTLLNSQKPEASFLIGDTPSDILAGKAIGATTIGVGTGSHIPDDFREVGADIFLSDLSEVEKVLEILGWAPSLRRK